MLPHSVTDLVVQESCWYDPFIISCSRLGLVDSTGVARPVISGSNDVQVYSNFSFLRTSCLRCLGLAPPVGAPAPEPPPAADLDADGRENEMRAAAREKKGWKREIKRKKKEREKERMKENRKKQIIYIFRNCDSYYIVIR
jgi:hypothetical protein